MLTSAHETVSIPSSQDGRRAHAGYSLVEAMIVVTIMGVLVAFAVPSYHRSLEQSRVDVAGAKLYAIWGAQRCYYLEYRTFTSNLNNLSALGLIDPDLIDSEWFSFTISAADDDSFQITATRIGSTRFSGMLWMDQNGSLNGQIADSQSTPMTPGFD